jgi:hypothetical protein
MPEVSNPEVGVINDFVMSPLASPYLYNRSAPYEYPPRAGAGESEGGENYYTFRPEI